MGKIRSKKMVTKGNGGSLKNEKIYIYEVPSATDSIRKLNEKMEKQCTQLGDKCGGFGIIHIKGE